MNKHTLIVIYPILYLILIGTSAPAYSWVKDISLERVFVGENTRVHEVAVKCRIQQKPRILRKVISSDGAWCSVDLPELCSEQKISAARKLCRYGASEFRELVESGNTKPIALPGAENVDQPAIAKMANVKADLLEEKMLVEERRIRIEQRRIELRRREVALKKELSLMVETAVLDGL